MVTIAQKYLLLALALLAAHAVAQRAETAWEVLSPDKQIKVIISQRGRQLNYSVTRSGAPAIEPSPLGIMRDDQEFSKDLKLISKSTASVDEAYVLAVGKRRQGRNRANELTLVFNNERGAVIQLIFRAYDHGMAYRYRFPDQGSTVRKIVREESGFVIPKNAKAWIQPYDLNSRKKPCYEAFYENGITIGSPSPNPAGWAFPALFHAGSLWVLLTEAGLDESYPATHLEDKNGNGTYTIRFPEKEEVTSDADPEPVSTLPWSTPWRVAIIGSSLTTIQESMLVTDLNPPSIISDISWVKPGRSSWSWWSDGGTPKDFTVQKEYVDFTAEMTWEYVLVDAGWPQMKNGSMEDLVKYANTRNVGLVLWYHSGVGREKDTLSYANLMAFPESRRRELQKLRQWGVKGVKVDFFDSDKQPVIKRYIDILEDAAEFRIMVNFHGSTLPRGWERTYPHLVSMESVKGAEGAGRQEFCDRAPSHNTILPFTRNVVGSMDYTPVTFTNKRQAIRQTTPAHELALAVVFESGVFHFADNMRSYQALPDGPKTFLKRVPTVWDETRYVSGTPGKFAVVARRNGDHWYIGGINGLDAGQEISFKVPFPKNASNLRLITDGETPGTFKELTVNNDGRNVQVTMQARGGFVMFSDR